MEIEEILYINLHPKKSWNGIYSLLMRADARGAMTSFTARDTYHYFAGRALLMTSQK